MTLGFDYKVKVITGSNAPQREIRIFLKCDQLADKISVGLI